MEEKTIEIERVRVSYKRAGERGPLVFILHGWGGSAASWVKVQELLADKGFRVIVPDLPGFGKSDEPPSPWGVGDYADWFQSFIRAITKSYNRHLETYLLLGHSFGGRVAIKLAAAHPPGLQKLVLVSAAGIKKRVSPFVSLVAKTLDWLFSLPLLRRFKPPLRAFSYRYVLRRTGYLKAQGVMKEVFQKVVAEDLQPLLKQIMAPTLIVWGEKDKLTPLEDARLMRREIPHAQLEVLKDIGHAPNLQNPQLLTEKVLTFLQERF